MSNVDYDEEVEWYYYTSCPSCGRAYDEIDEEYQICQYCEYDANEDIKKINEDRSQ